MNVRLTPRYVEGFDNLPADRQQAVLGAITNFTESIDQKKTIPGSLGLKPFRGTRSRYWEFRSTLADRILFNWEAGGVVLRFVGSHDDLRKFARSN